MQGEGIDFHKTFASITNWSTARLIIMMADMDGWESSKIDYVVVFYQEPIDSGVLFIYQQVFM